MEILWNRLSALSRPGPRPSIGGSASVKAAWAEKLLYADLAAVRFIARSARPAFGRSSAIVISKLGNGWLYPIIGAILFASLGSAGFRVVALAGLNAILLHCLYPLIKRRIGRPRPFRADPRLTSLLTVLDEHSFPSGHAMTLSGVLVPIVLVLPATILSAVALVCCMAWSRIATAHHYPSDIFAGVAMGVVLAYPLSTYLLAVW